MSNESMNDFIGAATGCVFIIGLVITLIVSLLLIAGTYQSGACVESEQSLGAGGIVANE